MKHNIAITFELLFWTAIALMFGFITAPHILQKQTEQLPVSPLIFVFIVVVIMVVAGLIWLKMFKSLSPDVLVGIFSGGIGAIMYRTIKALFPFTTNSAIFDIIIGLLIIYGCGFGFYILVKHMQKSWKNTQRWYSLANLVMVAVIPVVATIMSKGVPLWAAMILLFLIACYDAYAVWKSKHMIELAQTFMRLRILPGVVVPREKQDQFAILGGGDIFFISFISASAYATSSFAAIAVLLGGFAAIIYLFLASKKKKFYPAIPFILVGVGLGLAIEWVIRVLL